MKPKVGFRRLLLARLLMFLLLFSATSCFWGDEYGTKQLTGQYYLSKAEPSSDYWCLYFEEGEENILGEPLFNRWIEKVGFNDTCIIMQAVGAAPEFYIARITNTKDRGTAHSNVLGPLTKKEFQASVQAINGDILLRFNPDLTKSRW